MGTARPTDAPGFSTSRFRAEREADWIAFDTLLGRLETRGAKALSSDELLQLPILYRATLSSLSIARATILDKALLDHLEGLAMRGYFLIYGVRETRLSRLRRFFLYDWPAAVRAVWKETLIIALIITLGALTSWSLVAHNPEWYYNFVPEEMAGGATRARQWSFCARHWVTARRAARIRARCTSLRPSCLPTTAAFRSCPSRSALRSAFRR